MFSIRFNLDIMPAVKELAEMKLRIRDFVQKEAAELALRALKAAEVANRRLVPQDTFGLVDNIKFRKTARGGGEGREMAVRGGATLTWRQPYAAAVDKGAKRHYIRPRNAKALHWVDPVYGPVWYTIVDHPGIRKPANFSAPILREATLKFLKVLGRKVAKAMVTP
jgi:hypothetical protein